MRFDRMESGLKKSKSNLTTFEFHDLVNANFQDQKAVLYDGVQLFFNNLRKNQKSDLPHNLNSIEKLIQNIYLNSRNLHCVWIKKSELAN